jgi:hypothetical protein
VLTTAALALAAALLAAGCRISGGTPLG